MLLTFMSSSICAFILFFWYAPLEQKILPDIRQKPDTKDNTVLSLPDTDLDIRLDIGYTTKYLAEYRISGQICVISYPVGWTFGKPDIRQNSRYPIHAFHVKSQEEFET